MPPFRLAVSLSFVFSARQDHLPTPEPPILAESLRLRLRKILSSPWSLSPPPVLASLLSLCRLSVVSPLAEDMGSLSAPQNTVASLKAN
jgi:hypothetical protein